MRLFPVPLSLSMCERKGEGGTDSASRRPGQCGHGYVRYDVAGGGRELKGCRLDINTNCTVMNKFNTSN